MAKSSRASTTKANNQRLKAKVFGPVEKARMERLSAKLQEIAAAPKPPKPEENQMNIVDETEEEAKAGQDEAAMDVDSTKPSAGTRNSKNRIAKRKKHNKIVFPKYSDRKKTNKR